MQKVVYFFAVMFSNTAGNTKNQNCLAKAYNLCAIYNMDDVAGVRRFNPFAAPDTPANSMTGVFPSHPDSTAHSVMSMCNLFKSKVSIYVPFLLFLV